MNDLLVAQAKRREMWVPLILKRISGIPISDRKYKTSKRRADLSASPDIDFSMRIREKLSLNLGRLTGVVITIDISTETMDRLVSLAAAIHNGSISQWLEDIITREVELAAESYSPPKEAMHTNHINGDHSEDRSSPFHLSSPDRR